MFLNYVDSIVAEGPYLHAMEQLDSVEKNYQHLFGCHPSELFYMNKTSILFSMEEWEKMVETVERYKELYCDRFTDGVAAVMFSMQGHAYRQLEEYLEAIRSYENGAHYYNKKGDIGSQGDMLCNMARCYLKLGKYTIASRFYDNGIDKFLEYFGTTRSALLKRDFNVKDSYKQKVLAVFADHLYSLAVYEQNHGTRQVMRKYLLMAAHCGNDLAKSEYKRIFGHFYE